MKKRSRVFYHRMLSFHRSGIGKASTSPNRLSCIFIIAAVVTLFFYSCAGTPAKIPDKGAQGVDLAAAWKDLWADRFTMAESAFRASLSSNPGNAEATRGLALALFSRGAELESASLLVDMLTADPSTPFADAIQAFAIEVMPDGKISSEKLRKLAEQEVSRKTQPEISRIGWHFLADYYKYNDPDASRMRSAAENLGALAAWKIIGPFPNASASGFRKDFIGETKVESWGTGDFSAADGRKLSWTEPDNLPPNAFIRPENYLGYEKWGSVYYATGSFNSKKAGDYRLFIERNGSISVWLDGALVVADGEERLGGEYRSSAIPLGAGTHKILVKLASEDLLAGFRLSAVLTSEYVMGGDKALSLIASLKESAAGDANERLGDALATSSASAMPDAGFWCARFLYDCGYYTSALSTIAKARDKGIGESALFDYLEYRCLAALGRNTESRNALTRAGHRDILFAPTVDSLLGEYISEKRFAEAKYLLTKSKAFFGKWRRGDLQSISLAIASNGDVYNEAATYTSTYPDSPDGAILIANEGLGYGFDIRSLVSEIKSKGRPYEADRILLNYAAKAELQSDIYTLASSYAVLSPDLANVRYLLEDSSIRTGKFGLDEAILRAGKLAASFPGSTDLATLASGLAENKLIMAQKSAAESKSKDERVEKELTAARDQYIDRLSALLWLRPSDYVLREQLRTAKKLPDLDIAETSSTVEKSINDYEAERKVKPSPESDAEIVLDESSTIFFGDGASRFYRFSIIKMLSMAGVEAESSQNLDRGYGIKVTQAFTLKADGSKIEARLGSATVSFPGLSKGDYIVLRYQGNNYNPGALARHFWISAPLQHDYPAYLTEVRISYPAASKPSIEVHNDGNFALPRTEELVEPAMQRLKITARDMPAIPSGTWSADPRDTSTWLDVSDLPSWTEIAHWYTDLFYGRTKPEESVRRKAMELTAGITDRRLKIAKLYDFVANAVHYEDLSFMYSAYIPQRAESVLEDRFGDCKDKCALLVSLLSACDIEAEVALSAPDYRGMNRYLPSMRFTHIIVMVADPAGDLILDPTDQYSTFPRLAESLQGSWYLPIDRSGTKEATLARIPFSSAMPPTSIFLEITVGNSLRPEVKGSAAMGSEYAGAMRYSYSPNAPERRQNLMRRLMASLLPGLELSSYEAKGIEGGVESQDPTLEFEGFLPPLAARGGLAVLTIPWATQLPLSLETLAADGKDVLSVDYAAFASPVTETIVAQLPEGWKAAMLPEDKEYRFGQAYARFHYSAAGSSIVCTRELYLPYLVVGAGERKSFLSFVQSVGTKGRELILASTSGAAE